MPTDLERDATTSSSSAATRLDGGRSSGIGTLDARTSLVGADAAAGDQRGELPSRVTREGLAVHCRRCAELGGLVLAEPNEEPLGTGCEWTPIGRRRRKGEPDEPGESYTAIVGGSAQRVECAGRESYTDALPPHLSNPDMTSADRPPGCLARARDWAGSKSGEGGLRIRASTRNMRPTV